MREAGFGLALAVVVVFGAPVGAQTKEPVPASPPVVRAVLRNWTRVEMWRFFEPPPGGGNPRYTHVGNRLQFGLERQRAGYDLLAAFQYVQFGGLPTGAVGPGPLGTGALYFDQGGRTTSRHLYPRYLYARVKDLVPGWSVQGGRFGYTSGAESASGDPAIEALKRLRVDSRLLGEFEWALFQRSYDGVRTDIARRRWHASAAAFHPTQGGFEDAAGVDISAISVYAGTFTAKPALVGHTDWQAFAIRYTDDRAVSARPDNSGLTASRVDVGVSTFGTTLVGVYPLGSVGRGDAVLWFAQQTGRWYGQRHRAAAIAAEAGVQWPDAPWRPWVRAGVTRASGDADPRDDTHGTFFQVLPTVRKYSLSATYSVMNLSDLFAQVLATPRPALSLRVDVHRLALVQAADRWYFGSGATQASGTTFGYGARPSQGATGLGTVVESAVDYRIDPHWSVNGYLGWIRGGEVVTRTFAGRALVFGYVENVLQF